MKHLPRVGYLTVILALAVAGCGDDEQETTPETTTETTAVPTPETLTIIAHDSFAGGVDESTFATFTEETGVEVDVLAAGDAGSTVNQAILTRDNPLADVLFGVDDTFLSRGLDEGIFLAHESAHIDTVDPSLRVDGDEVTPIDFGDVCFNYDKDWFEGSDLEVPESLDDLRDEEYASLVTVQHPATSSPGLAFLLATVDVYGEEGWLDWWTDTRDSGINVANDWDSTYYGEFTRYGGPSPIVMSYASSPPAEVIFAEDPPDEAPTGVIESGCYRQIEYAGILDGTDHPETAGELIDFMLSVEFQEAIPLTWFVFPANQEAALPPEFVEHTAIPDSPTTLSSHFIAENRDRWIDEWIGVMGG